MEGDATEEPLEQQMLRTNGNQWKEVIAKEMTLDIFRTVPFRANITYSMGIWQGAILISGCNREQVDHGTLTLRKLT